MLLTVVFRARALIPIYIYVFIQGLYAGFNMWWMPYLYIWAVLWGITMLIPKGLSQRAACIVYPTVCALHGFAYGTLYAPFQAFVYHLGWEGMLAWIVSGVKFDILHGLGNFAFGLLIVPLSELFLRLTRKYSHR
jgi:energy-coupling factor transport system substrate-specific component